MQVRILPVGPSTSVAIMRRHFACAKLIAAIADANSRQFFVRKLKFHPVLIAFSSSDCVSRGALPANSCALLPFTGGGRVPYTGG
jgi:hypothetical protein